MATTGLRLGWCNWNVIAAMRQQKYVRCNVEKSFRIHGCGISMFRKTWNSKQGKWSLRNDIIEMLESLNSVMHNDRKPQYWHREFYRATVFHQYFFTALWYWWLFCFTCASITLTMVVDRNWASLSVNTKTWSYLPFKFRLNGFRFHCRSDTRCSLSFTTSLN